jgi:hypothetical protein
MVGIGLTTDKDTVMNQAPFGNNLLDDDALLPEAALQQGVISTPPPAPKGGDSLAAYKKRVWIILQDNEQIPPTGLFVGHNGRGFMIKANVAVEVPVELIEILNNAIYDAPLVDQQTKQIIGYTPRLRFPYSVVRAPQPQDQAA